MYLGKSQQTTLICTDSVVVQSIYSYRVKSNPHDCQSLICGVNICWNQSNCQSDMWPANEVIQCGLMDHVTDNPCSLSYVVTEYKARRHMISCTVLGLFAHLSTDVTFLPLFTHFFTFVYVTFWLRLLVISKSIWIRRMHYILQINITLLFLQWIQNMRFYL